MSYTLSREQNMKDKEAIHLFRKKTVLTIKQLSEILDSSEITSRRKLKRWGCFNSINANSRYYVLPDIPRFDANGLWIYRQICFSKHGYLKQSIVCLIRQSEAGIQTQDILKLVGLPDNSSVLSQVMRISGIQR